MFYHNEYYLVEFAGSRKELLTNLPKQGDFAITHLLCIYFWPNTQYVGHWISEVYSALPAISKMKGNNKFPKAKDIYHKLFGIREDIFVEQFDIYVDLVANKEPDLQIPTNLNANKIHDYLNDYFHWLSNELSKNGKITKVDVEDKIHELLSKYH